MKILILGMMTLISISAFAGNGCRYITNSGGAMTQSEVALQTLGYARTDAATADLALISYVESNEYVQDLLVTYKANGWAQVQVSEGAIVSEKQTKRIMEIPYEGGLGYSPAKRQEAYRIAYKKLDQKTAKEILKQVRACN